MWNHPSAENNFDLLEAEIDLAETVTPILMRRVIVEACVRLTGLRHTDRAARLNRLLDAGAWTEVALALLEIEFPQWTVRRLVRDDGEWLCSLSRQPNLPAEFDDTVDVTHEVLPLALLRAFLQVRREASKMRELRSSPVQAFAPEAETFNCCDNFV